MTHKEIAEKALEQSIKQGCSNARIKIYENAYSYYSVRDNKLERLHQANETSLNIQLFINDRYGTFSTNRINEEELSLLITKGIETTKCLSPDICRQLPDKDLYYKGGGEDLLQLDHSFGDIKSSEKIKIATDIASEIYNTDKRLISVTSDYSDNIEKEIVIDSQGFSQENSQSYFSLSAECSVSGKKGSKPTASWYETSLFFQRLKKEDIGRIALQKALAKINTKKLKSGKYNMVVENTVSTRFISPLITALHGASLQQNNSFLINSLNKKVFSSKFSLLDTPHKKGRMGARYFDNEGIATKPTTIIDKGIVNTYFINTYYSKKMGIPVTIGSPSVITCAAEQELSQSEILTKVGTGILITGFNGGNSNSTTGDFSYGIEGFYFENGEIQFPVKEMIVTGNLISLWNNLLMVGTEIKESGIWLAPSIAFSDVTFNGI